jgi:ABC-type multidrug transport system permease subunit
MKRQHPLGQLLLARLREFYREPEVIFWVYGFPLILAVGLFLAFTGKEPEPPAVDVQGDPAASQPAAVAAVLRKGGLPAEVHPEAECQARLNRGNTALYVVPMDQGYRYIYDKARPECLLAYHWADDLLTRHASTRAPVAEPVSVETPGDRYIDFLMPGLIGMNLMGGGLWGVGFVIVDMRVRKLLKRLLATPMRRSDFLLAILGSRLVFMLPEMLLLLLFGWLAFGVPVRCPLPTLVLVIVIGAAAFAGIGLLVACRSEKSETVSGLMNLVMLPQWLLSGTFFSSDRFPEVMQPLVQVLPLTQLNGALRAVMLQDRPLPEIAWRLGILVAWGSVCFALALRWFRWR